MIEYLCLSISIPIYKSWCICMHISIHIYIYRQAYVYAEWFTLSLYICTDICVCKYVYIYMNGCLYTFNLFMYTHVWVHANICTHFHIHHEYMWQHYIHIHMMFYPCMNYRYTDIYTCLFCRSCIQYTKQKNDI